MELKEIIKKAKENFLEMFSSRMYNDTALLEEVEPLNDDKWKITLSFYEKTVNGFNTPMVSLGNSVTKVYKILFLDKDGNIEQIKNYD